MVCLENHLGFSYFTEKCILPYLNALICRHAPDEVNFIYKNDATISEINYCYHCTLVSKIQTF